MPAKRLSMRKIKEVMRLKWDQGLSNRKIAAVCGIARPTVSEYLRRAEGADLSWPLPGDVTDTHLESLLFPPMPALPAQDRGIPNWLRIHQELNTKASRYSCSGRNTGKPALMVTRVIPPRIQRTHHWEGGVLRN